MILNSGMLIITCNCLMQSGGYSHIKAYGDVLPKWVTLSQKKSLDTGPILVKKSLEEGPISQKLQKNKNKKNVKSAVFVVENPLEMGPDLRKNSQISHFLRDKNP